MKARCQFLFCFCVGAVVLQPWLTARYYRFMLHHGAYRWDADSIAIPIASNFGGWLLWAPLVIFATWKAFQHLAAPPGALAWERKRPAKSSVITLVFLAGVYVSAQDIPDAVIWKNWAEVAYSNVWCVVWLVLRAAALSPKAEQVARANAATGDKSVAFPASEIP